MRAVQPILVGVNATAQSVAQGADAYLQINLANAVRSSNKAYRNEWHNFRLWVDAQCNGAIIPPGDTYLRPENVELYFMEVITLKAVTGPMARRVLNALQWHANNIENILPKVNLESQKVKVALKPHLLRQK
jgi:hypothetical protein